MKCCKTKYEITFIMEVKVKNIVVCLFLICLMDANNFGKNLFSCLFVLVWKTSDRYEVGIEERY